MKKKWILRLKTNGFRLVEWNPTGETWDINGEPITFNTKVRAEQFMRDAGFTLVRSFAIGTQDIEVARYDN